MYKNKNNIKLITSIILDVIGCASYVIPVIGEFSDVVFAPIQAIYILLVYQTTPRAILGGLEEILPFTDIIPSCTLAHLKTFSKSKNHPKT